VIVYAATLYADWCFPLSPESQQYQAEYPDAIRSGLSIWYLLSKIAAVLGSSSGVIGVVRILLSKRRGLVFMALAAPLVAWAAYLQAPESNYPSVAPIPVLLLWCTSSALWAAVVALEWTREA
jgi:hypothetical protein